MSKVEFLELWYGVANFGEDGVLRDLNGQNFCRDRLDEKALEESFQQEKDAERREADRRAQEHDQTYKIALRKWEMHER